MTHWPCGKGLGMSFAGAGEVVSALRGCKKQSSNYHGTMALRKRQVPYQSVWSCHHWEAEDSNKTQLHLQAGAELSYHGSARMGENRAGFAL